MPYVTREEFECPCCGENKVKNRLVTIFDLARQRSGIPFDIRNGSGYRCAAHNEAVGGRENSSHLTGDAGDIPVTGSRERWLVIEALIAFGINRIGIAPTFIHADIDGTKDKRVIWLYD